MTKGLIAVEDALARVLDGVRPLGVERVAVEAACGRVLAEDLRALRTQPPDDVSAMDGYAVRARDVAAAPVSLRVIGEVAAGKPFAGSVGAGEAVRIFTGGVVPQGADAIALQEDVTRAQGLLQVPAAVAAGRHVRRRGIDFREGDALLARGRRLSPRDCALAAALNHPTLSVHRRPLVAIFSTGDELRPPGSVLQRGQIVSSNGLALSALLRAEGAEAVDFGIVADDAADTVAAVRRARDLGANILVTSGGASVGDYDLVQAALTAEGLALGFWKVAIRPGKPLLSGRLAAMRVLGLPGNPVSSYVCAVVFLLPLVRAFLGEDVATPRLDARLGRALPANDEREDYLRAQLFLDAAGLVATALPDQDSSLISPLARADGLIIRPPFAPAAAMGAPCRVIQLRI